MMSNGSLGRAIALLVLAALIVAAPVLAQDVCASYDKKHTITALETHNAFSKKGVKSPGDLAMQLREQQAAVASVLNDHGLGHLTEALINAVETGDGLSERALTRGETFDWMVYREKGTVVSKENMCFAAKKTYEAYVVEVSEVDETDAKASCDFSVNVGDCPERKVSVSAASNVELSVSGVGAVPSNWADALAPGAYTVTATSSATGTKTTTTHTFVIPKACLNISYVGKTVKKEDGQPSTCEESKEVTVENCMPTCTLTAPTEVPRRQPFSIQADGYYDNITLSVTNADGKPAKMKNASGQKVTSFAPDQDIIVKKVGTYTVTGTATNAVGEAECSTSFNVIRDADIGGWTVRALAFSFKADDDRTFKSVFRDNGVNERATLQLDGGQGLGLDIERRINERIGVQGSVLFGIVDTMFMFDLDNDWGMADDDANMKAITLGVNFHLSPNSNVDFYIGPFLGWVDINEVDFDVLGENQRRDFGDDTAFGLLLGLDIPFGGGDWGLHLGARYMDFAVDSDDGDLTVDPLLGEVGFFWNF